MNNLSIYRRNPAFFNGFDRLFNGLFDGNEQPNIDRVPLVDVQEEKDHYNLQAELPGMNQSDIKVELEDGVLAIEARKDEKTNAKTENSDYLIQERRSTSFTRKFVLPKEVDEAKIKAEFVNGVLTLTIPKTQKSKARSIAIA